MLPPTRLVRVMPEVRETEMTTTTAATQHPSALLPSCICLYYGSKRNMAKSTLWSVPFLLEEWHRSGGVWSKNVRFVRWLFGGTMAQIGNKNCLERLSVIPDLPQLLHFSTGSSPRWPAPRTTRRSTPTSARGWRNRARSGPPAVGRGRSPRRRRGRERGDSSPAFRS